LEQIALLFDGKNAVVSKTNLVAEVYLEENAKSAEAREGTVEQVATVGVKKY